MIRIGKVTLKSIDGYATVRRQTVCENGNWIYAVFEFMTLSSLNTWVRVR